MGNQVMFWLTSSHLLWIHSIHQPAAENPAHAGFNTLAVGHDTFDTSRQCDCRLIWA
jgi:hypothetical protein